MRILVVSDLHANFIAFEAVLKDAGSIDKIWCLGDVVGYGPQPSECINCLQEFDHICLAGNHDLAVAGKAPLWDFSEDAKEVVFWTRHHLTIEALDWLQALPTILVREGPISMVHASPRDPVWEYITDIEIAKKNLELIETAVCLHGHTHFPGIFRQRASDKRVLEESPLLNIPIQLIQDRMLINPGSVGQPRDEDPRAAYAILETDTMTYFQRRVIYDITKVQNLMKQEKFSTRLIRRLRFGQ